MAAVAALFVLPSLLLLTHRAPPARFQFSD